MKYNLPLITSTVSICHNNAFVSFEIQTPQGHHIYNVHITYVASHTQTSQIFLKFRRNLTSLQKTFIISETINDRENLKKALESQWNSLLLKWRQIWPEVNGLTSGGHQNSKQVFCRKLVLPITFLFSKIGEWSKRHRVCLVKPNLLIYDMTSKGQRKDFTWGQGHEVTQISGDITYTYLRGQVK